MKQNEQIERVRAETTTLLKNKRRRNPNPLAHRAATFTVATESRAAGARVTYVALKTQLVSTSANDDDDDDVANECSSAEQEDNHRIIAAAQLCRKNHQQQQAKKRRAQYGRRREAHQQQPARVGGRVVVLFAAAALATLTMLQLLFLLQGSSGSSCCALGLDLNEPAPEEAAAVAAAAESFTSEQQQQAAPQPAHWMESIKRKAGGAFHSARAQLSAPAISASIASRVTALQLPKYFDFELFKSTFKRKYDGSTEESGGAGSGSSSAPASNSMEVLYRKSLFLRKCMQVFRARVAYRLGRSTHLEAINKFSDRNEAELKRMFMSGPPIEFKPQDQSEEEYYTQLERVHRQRVLDEERANLQDREFDSRACAEDPADAGTDENNSLDPAGHSSACSSSFFHEAQARRQLELMMAQSARFHDEQLKFAIEDELRGASRETFSQSAAVDSQVGADCPTDWRGAGNLSPGGSGRLPWPGRRLSMTSSSSSSSTGAAAEAAAANTLDLNTLPASSSRMQVRFQQQSSSSLGDTTYRAPQLSRCDQLDWSKHECFHTIYDQGDKCGKCYVMASTSLAEFYKCSEHDSLIDKRKFSKDYVLECAQKFSPTILGCLGGSLLDTLRFIGLAGVYNIRGWRERQQLERAKLKRRKLSSGGGDGSELSELDAKCPLNQFELPFRDWGEIKVTMKPERVHPNQWMEALQDGPIVVSIQMPSVGLDTYEGGVHEGTGCEDSGNWHAMLLVGYGRDQASGLSYWRLRNSWGENWGDRGHMNLAMDLPAACLAGGVRVYRETMRDDDEDEDN